MTDPLLRHWLLDIATEPPESWYADSRLALADWLEERGDGRAEAVRDSPESKRARAALADEIASHYSSGGTLRPDRYLMVKVRTVASVEWSPESTSRERHRLLSLFPEVVLTGPCPRHEPLPEGVTAYVQYQGNHPSATLGPGWCPWCGNRPRTAPAPKWQLDREQVAFVPPGGIWRWMSPPAPRGMWSLTVYVGPDNQPLRIPAVPVWIPPATNAVGEPL